MTKEELLKDCILAKYGSVSEFSKQSGIPNTTIRNIFTRGLDGVGVATVLKMCKFLNIDVEELMKGRFSVRPNPQKELVSTSEATLLALHRQLNEEGQEKLLSYADDLVSSGNYIKSDPLGLVAK